jgi:hypothetical protein
MNGPGDGAAGPHAAHGLKPMQAAMATAAEATMVLRYLRKKT